MRVLETFPNRLPLDAAAFVESYTVPEVETCDGSRNGDPQSFQLPCEETELTAKMGEWSWNQQRRALAVEADLWLKTCHLTLSFSSYRRGIYRNVSSHS
jgi:hypothetical protein